MSALVIKTGMEVEYQIARRYAAPDILVLTGAATATSLDQVVPQDCKAVLSLGVCGGLAPEAQIGQAFIYDRVLTPETMELGWSEYKCDSAWRKRLFAATRYYERSCWSSGQFNTANTVAARASLFGHTNCWIIDDESYAVAQFAAKRGIAFIGLRTVSDGAEDNLPPAVINALNPNGTDNLWNVVASVAEDPLQIPALIKTALEAKRAFDELETACIAVGPNFQWE
jgi:adenosylhomocysteine nucleosidase